MTGASAEPLRLRPLQAQDEAEVLSAQRELGAEGFSFCIAYEPGVEWPRLGELQLLGRGVSPPG